MRVCLNAFHFNPGQMGGTETYFRELVRHLQLTDNRIESLIIFINSLYHDEFAASESLSIEPVVIYSRPHIQWFTRAVLSRGLGFNLYARKLANVKADIIHYPFSVILPQVVDRPTVLTFWDMQHEFYPGFFSRKELIHRNRLYRLSAQQASHIIVSATFTKECIIDRYNIDSSKISVIHTGYSPSFKSDHDTGNSIRIKEQYSIDRPFMYYPAASWPHKNHLKLIDALKILVDSYQFDGLLVLSGIPMQSYNEITRKISESGVADHVRMLGYLQYSELPTIYNLARMLVFPSLFEGFGIPLVEAMACGCPIAASNTTSIPEVVGDAGVLFDPASPDEMASTIARLWYDDGELSRLRGIGLKRSKLFTWDNTAKQTLEVYRSLTAL